LSEECKPECVGEAMEAIRASIRGYLAANCRRTLALARLAGQERVRLEYRGFYRHYQPTQSFPKFTDALRYLFKCLEEEVEVDGIELAASAGSSAHATISLRTLEELCRD